MKEGFSVRFLTFSDGERYPILLNTQGQPHGYATLYATTQVRNNSKAPNTIAAVLASIRVLLTWSVSMSIDLEDRFSRKMLLNEQELEALRSYTQIMAEDTNSKPSQKIVHRIENARGKMQRSVNRISSGTQYIRMTYIADYLEWLAVRLIERDARQVDAGTLKLIHKMSGGLRARRPQKAMQSREGARKGLTEEQQKELLAVIQPQSDKNPFSEPCQIRNQIMVWLLYHLGLRAGELLALRVSDFDFRANTVLIARRHDAPQDPRTYQPVVKTVDRRIPLSEALVKAVSDYVMKERRQFVKAKKHEYLFVVHQTGPFAGQPLSTKGLAKVFQELQTVDPNLFQHLTPHVLRHTANDRFSALMDKQGSSPAEEEKMRSYIMGWKEGSGTAGTYTRRHVENKAREAALLLQKPLYGDDDV